MNEKPTKVIPPEEAIAVIASNGKEKSFYEEPTELFESGSRDPSPITPLPGLANRLTSFIPAALAGCDIDPLEITGQLKSVELSSHLQQLLEGQVPFQEEKDKAKLRDSCQSPFRARYLIANEIGHGGMGIVYRGWDLQLQRHVAIKIIRKDQRGKRHSLLRFLREARIASRLRHPGILPIHDFDVEPSGSAYIIMDLISGNTMDQGMRASSGVPSNLPSMLTTFLQICHAIAFAHANGVVHRDLKPSNIMVGEYGTATVLDWGLAKILGNSGVKTNDMDADVPFPLARLDGLPGLLSPGDSCSTLFGTVLGTPHYLAPEQARGEEVDYRGDVFSLGGILCRLLTGFPPFIGSKVSEVFEKSIAGDVQRAFESLEQSRAPGPVIALARWCLMPNPADRPANAGILVERLRSFLESRQRRAEEELIHFFDLSLDLFCIANTRGYFQRINENFSRVLGYSVDELTTRQFISFVHPEDQPKTLTEIAMLARGEPTIQFVNRYRHKEGHFIWLEWTARSIREEGVIYAVARDVSERIRLEKEKVRAEADCMRLAEIVRAASDAIIGLDGKGLVQNWNSGAERLFGFSANEILGKSFGKLLPAERSLDEREILEHLQGGTRVEFCGPVCNHGSGELVYASFVFSPIRETSGKVVGGSMIARPSSRSKTGT